MRAIENETHRADRQPYLIQDSVLPTVTFSILTNVSKEETQAERVVLVACHGFAPFFLFLRLPASLARSLARAYPRMEDCTWFLRHRIGKKGTRSIRDMGTIQPGDERGGQRITGVAWTHWLRWPHWPPVKMATRRRLQHLQASPQFRRRSDSGTDFSTCL